ncbi:hypothetical protein PQR62_05450 [Herbaspirillum lusitanum]|uniref:Uncharacterized protein n=1 Tax=Herbaspirillum lusitanum TaxID=213312 RepID=A0ABW9A5I7_9BURK
MTVDTVGLFGTEMSRFSLPDGSSGVLRRAPNGELSIKFDRYMRVVPLQNVTSARIARVETVGQRAVVVVEIAERNCAYKYEVLSIEGGDVLDWRIGNCMDRPRVQKSLDGRALTFDFPLYNQISRVTYADKRMLSATLPVPPGVDVRVKPFADESLQAPPPMAGDGAAIGGRYIPLPPQRDDSTRTGKGGSSPEASSESERKSRRKAAPAPRPAPTTPKSSAALPPASPAWTFSGEEIKPTPIDLR